MNLGKLDSDNLKFLNQYKRLGFASKTDMANEALRTLKQLKAKEWRAKWRELGHKEYLAIKPQPIWKDLDGEDFED